MMNNAGPEVQTQQQPPPPPQYEQPIQQQQQQQPEYSSYPEDDENTEDSNSKKTYPTVIQTQDDQKDFESPGEVTNALTNAVLDMEMAEEVQLEEKEEKLFSNKMADVEQQIRTDISNAVHNIKSSSNSGDMQNEQVIEDEINLIQAEATYTLEEKA